MNKRPGHVVVTTEVAMCSFCGRPRTLRNEQHQLGSLVRTIVTCETCHRTLSSSMTGASSEPTTAQPAAVESALVPETAGTSVPAETHLEKAAAKPAQRKPTPSAPKATAAKSRTQKKTK